MPRISEAKAGGRNVRAFLDMLAWSEGTSTIKASDDGYNVIVGGGLFSGYADHPRRLVDLPKLGIKSTAAGRYQLLARYWDAYRKQLGLAGFTPENQDLVALQQIRERKALDDIKAGRIAEAIGKCRNIWASLPGAGYGQREHTLDDLLAYYIASGGVLA
jgi:muramidase (phage lysozyme)